MTVVEEKNERHEFPLSVMINEAFTMVKNESGTIAYDGSIFGLHFLFCISVFVSRVEEREASWLLIPFWISSSFCIARRWVLGFFHCFGAMMLTHRSHHGHNGELRIGHFGTKDTHIYSPTPAISLFHSHACRGKRREAEASVLSAVIAAGFFSFGCYFVLSPDWLLLFFICYFLYTHNSSCMEQIIEGDEGNLSSHLPTYITWTINDLYYYYYDCFMNKYPRLSRLTI